MRTTVRLVGAGLHIFLDFGWETDWCLFFSTSHNWLINCHAILFSMSSPFESFRLPASSVSRLAKESLEDTVRGGNRISRPVLDLIGKSTALFILYVSDCALECADQRKKWGITKCLFHACSFCFRKTISVSEVEKALSLIEVTSSYNSKMGWFVFWIAVQCNVP